MDLLVNLSLRRDYSSTDDGKADDNFISCRVSKVSIPHRDYCLLEHSRSAFPLLRVSESEEESFCGLCILYNKRAMIRDVPNLEAVMKITDRNADLEALERFHYPEGYNDDE